ncbi:MAG: type-F conjugative transfer system secretin TraK [Gammaproteobacteria bacterium]|nr:type-F conjugative transfer system secretin TraK [Gammaproteobacteria bacterium]
MCKTIKIFLLLISLSGFTNSFALQAKAAKDNETLFFKISAREFTRIFVTGDRIISVKGKDNTYEIKEFNGKYDQGILYLKPSFYYQRRPFSIFITTEQGHTYTLFLNPIDVPAENVSIKPISASKRVASAWETNQSYTQLIIELMRQMVKEQHPEGYAVIPLGEVKPKRLSSSLTMQLLIIYRGSYLEGEIWRLKNNSNHRMNLLPQEFYQANTRAASLVDETLNCGDETLLYRVVSHE